MMSLCYQLVGFLQNFTSIYDPWMPRVVRMIGGMDCLELDTSLCEDLHGVLDDPGDVVNEILVKQFARVEHFLVARAFYCLPISSLVLTFDAGRISSSIFRDNVKHEVLVVDHILCCCAVLEDGATLLTTLIATKGVRITRPLTPVRRDVCFFFSPPLAVWSRVRRRLVRRLVCEGGDAFICLLSHPCVTFVAACGETLFNLRLTFLILSTKRKKKW